MAVDKELKNTFFQFLVKPKPFQVPFIQGRSPGLGRFNFLKPSRFLKNSDFRKN